MVSHAPRSSAKGDYIESFDNRHFVCIGLRLRQTVALINKLFLAPVLMPNLNPQFTHRPPVCETTLTHPPELAFYPFRGRRDAKLNHESPPPCEKRSKPYPKQTPHAGIIGSATGCL